MACRLGAERVIAIEPDDVIELAREVVLASGVDDRVELIQDVSLNVSLERPADVILSDLRGSLPPYRQHIPSLIDARERLLRKDGVLIPARDTLWAAAVEDPASYRRRLEVWRELAPGVDTESARFAVANTWWSTTLDPDTLLSDARPWATIDYRTVTDPSVCGSFEAPVIRAGTVHGLGMWFDAVLVDDVGFSGAPGAAALVYGHAFFPLLEPVAVEKGDTVSAEIEAHLLGSDYVWSWKTAVRRVRGDDVSFAQSTLFGAPISPATLHRAADTAVIELNDEGEILHAVLTQIAAGGSLGAVAKAISESFRARFEGWEDAFAYVTSVSTQYGR